MSESKALIHTIPAVYTRAAESLPSTPLSLSEHQGVAGGWEFSLGCLQVLETQQCSSVLSTILVILSAGKHTGITPANIVPYRSHFSVWFSSECSCFHDLNYPFS